MTSPPNIQWLNQMKEGCATTFLTVRGERNADGQQRIRFYFSAHAAKKLGLQASQYMLIGIDPEQHRMVMAPSPLGANRLTKKGVNGALSLNLGIGKQTQLPEPMLISESSVLIDGDMFSFPYAYPTAA